MKKFVSAIKANSKRVIVANGIGFIALAAYIFYREWDNISRVLTQADTRTLIFAGLLTIASYAVYLIGFVFIHRLFEFTVPITRLNLIGFVSTTINHLLPFASAGEYSLRAYALRQHGYAAKDSLTVSVVHSYLHNSIFFVLFPVFAAYVLLTYTLRTTASIVLVVSSIVSMVVFAIGTAIIFHAGGRDRILKVLNTLTERAHLDVSEDIHRLFSHFETAKSTLIDKKARFAILVAVFCVEWIVTALILYFCLEAVGYTIPLPQLMVGFILGVSMGLFSLLPSGIGVQEGTMTLAYIALGVPFEYAFLAPILFRALYYFVPSVVSLALYWFLLRDDQPDEETNVLSNSEEQ